jgi:hypothetical protein
LPIANEIAAFRKPLVVIIGTVTTARIERGTKGLRGSITFQYSWPKPVRSSRRVAKRARDWFAGRQKTGERV